MRTLFTFLAIATINCSYAQVPTYVPTNGLKAFWTFCNNANDVSGNGNNGTVSGAVLATDRFNVGGSAYSFNGTSDYISTTMTGILGNNARAVSFWSKTTESVSAMSAVSWGFEQSSPNAGVRYECAINCGAPSNVAIIGSDCAVGYNPPVNPSNNLWHHYIFQFAGGGSAQLNTVQIYQDGILLTAVNYTHNPNVVLNTLNNWPVNFGRIPYSIPHYYKGSLDEIGIWNRVLTIGEIQQLFNGNSGCNTTGLMEGGFENTNLSIYPNPNTGQFRIKADQTTEVTITNALGQTVFATILNQNERVEITDLLDGIYFVSGKTEYGKSQNKIVVSK